MLFYQIYLHFYEENFNHSCLVIFQDDFSVVSNYGKLSAQFHVGRLRPIEIVGFISVFKFLPEQLSEFILTIAFGEKLNCFLLT